MRGLEMTWEGVGGGIVGAGVGAEAEVGIIGGRKVSNLFEEGSRWT